MGKIKIFIFDVYESTKCLDFGFIMGYKSIYEVAFPFFSFFEIPIDFEYFSFYPIPKVYSLLMNSYLV